MKDYSNVQPGIYVDHVNDPLIVGPHSLSYWGDGSFIDAIQAVLVDKSGWPTKSIDKGYNLTFALPLEFVE